MGKGLEVSAPEWNSAANAPFICAQPCSCGGLGHTCSVPCSLLPISLSAVPAFQPRASRLGLPLPRGGLEAWAVKALSSLAAWNG